METIQVSTDRWMDKNNVVYLHSGILVIKEGNAAICNNMAGPGWFYGKWNKSDRKRY